MLRMIDVSVWQGEINWSRVAGDGIELAYVKATQGDRLVDQRFAANRAGAEAHGIRVGAYAYVEPGKSSPEAQAEHFARVVGELRRRELRPAQDIETGSPRGAAPFARAFSQRVAKLLKCTPLLYSYPGYLALMRLERPIGGGLWLASYGPDDGADHGAAPPAPWRRLVAHQYTSHGRAPGIAGNVDLSHAAKLRPLLAHPLLGLL